MREEVMLVSQPAGAGDGFNRMRIGAIVAVAAVVVFVAWLLLKGDDNDESSTKGSGPKAVTVQALRNLARSSEVPVFWAGPRSGYTYEYTKTKKGNLYVRYLPSGAPVGDRTPFLTVATYPLPNGYARLSAAAKRAGSNSRRIKGGGLVVYPRQPTQRAYLAYPGGKYQVEVFDPSVGRAQRVTLSGRVQAIR
jgi:hypothetical protein